jgi:DNA-binding CsgD family transcriptional regulator
LPAEEAASLLAMHCLVRAQTPDDYTILVVPRGELLASVAERAQRLLSAGRSAAGSSVPLSSRQREVLDQVMQGLSNKEIGTRLNVTERTVKFHVSRLLEKFRAHDRTSLKRAASKGMLPASAVPFETLFGFVVPARLAGAAEQAPPRNGSSRAPAAPRPASLLNFRTGRRETALPAAAVPADS